MRSDKGIANFSDRSLLKNLGHWLGMLTLGRNKPILQVYYYIIPNNMYNVMLQLYLYAAYKFNYFSINLTGGYRFKKFTR